MSDINKRARILSRVRKPWTVGKTNNLTAREKAFVQGMTNRIRNFWSADGYSRQKLWELMKENQ